MKKELIIKRLKATRAKMDELKEEQFDYEMFVSEWNEARTCGTVCCVAGWYPRWFPKAGVRFRHFRLICPPDMKAMLSKWHGVSFYIIDALFYGREFHSEYHYSNVYLSGGTELALWQVKARFDVIISAIERGKLDRHL